MTDREYEILDALYFTISFETLQNDLEAKEEEELIDEIIALHKKDWIKCLEKISEKEVDSEEEIKKNYKKYNFLASKKGLLAHNSR